MNYAAYVVTELNSKEIEGAEENIQQIVNYVNENLLKVTFLNIDFFDNVIRNISLNDFMIKSIFLPFRSMYTSLP